MPTSASQPRQIRLFLSSTFRDMENERHELLTRVFPLFRQQCLERQVVFSEIDLRWGITEEDAHNGQTVQICLEEIARCRALGISPFFIGFIGERYGWVPQRHELENYWHQAAQDENPYARRIEAALAEGISVTELEMRFGFMDDAQGVSRQRVQLYFRHPDLTASLAGKASATFYESTDAARDKLAALKRAIRETHAECIGVDGYQAISEFGQQILDFLTAELDTHFPLDEVPNERQLRLHAQQCYALSRRENYVPLPAFKQQVETRAQDMLAAMLPNGDQAREPLNRLALVGDSGRGKSAFMADLVASETFNTALVIAHFVGADGDNTPESWRERVLQVLTPYLPATLDVPTEDDARWAAFAELVSAAQVQMGKPIILLLDAINQFSPQEEGMRRLNGLRFLPGTLLVVTSTEPLPDTWQTLAFPELTEAHRREAITLFLRQYSKKLPETLVGQLVAAPACGNALFLRLVMEELRLHADHDSLAARVSALLTYDDAGQLFLALLNETDRDFRAEGYSLASHATTLIAASRAGVSHSDLAVLLAPHLHQSGLKMADQTLLRLLARIAPFCLNEDGRLRITHTIFTQTLTALSPLMSPSRRALVARFNQRDAFSVAERTYQWMALENYEQLVETLGHVNAFCALQQSYPELASQAMLSLGAGRSSLSLLLHALVENWNVWRPEVVFTPTMNAVSAWFLQRGFWQIGVRWSELAAVLVRKATPVNVINTMGTINSLALFYRLLGQYDKAEPLLHDALAMMRKMLPAGHPDIGVVLNNLAGIYGALGQPEKAEPLLREALQAVSNENSIDFANLAQSLGECYQQLEEYEQAESLLRKSLAVRTRLQARDNPHLIGLKRSLGGLYMELMRYDEAEPVLLEVLALRKAVLPPEHPDIATSLNDLGELYYRQGDADKAEPLFTQMMDIRRKSLSLGHPDFIAGLFYMAELYRSMGRLEDAASQLREAIPLLEHLPDNQAELLFARQSLANLYMEDDRHEKAIPLYEAMLTTQSELSRPESPVMLRLLDDLGMLYLGQDRLDEAAACWAKWLAVQEGKLAPENAGRLKVMRNLACTYKAQQKYQEAKALLLQIMSLRVEHDHGDVELKVQSVAEAAEMHYFLAEYAAAETLYRTLFTMVEPQWLEASPEKNALFQWLVARGVLDKTGRKEQWGQAPVSMATASWQTSLKVDVSTWSTAAQPGTPAEPVSMTYESPAEPASAQTEAKRSVGEKLRSAWNKLVH